MINLFVNYFEHPNKDRREEIEYCFEKNQSNEHINKIIVVNRGERATYGDFLKIMAEYPNDVNIIANSDIYFDDTVKYAENIKQRQCYALTRWEDIEGRVIDFNERHGKPSPPQWSQDAWIFRGSIDDKNYHQVQAQGNKMPSIIIPFSLGIPGCDNKFAAMLRESGIRVENPSKTIKAIHKHKNSNREYPPYRILKGIKPNGLVYPSTI
jgi:hypothetical protein